MDQNERDKLLKEVEILIAGFEPVTAYDENGEKHTVPLALALDAQGNPIPIAGDVEPPGCDHKGATWSYNLDCRCPRCGARMFLPPRHLANLDAATLDEMHQCWVDAGWPWHDNRGDGWLTDYAPTWTVEAHPLFDHVGGIAVRNDKKDDWKARWADGT